MEWTAQATSRPGTAAPNACSATLLWLVLRAAAARHLRAGRLAGRLPDRAAALPLLAGRSAAGALPIRHWQVRWIEAWQRPAACAAGELRRARSARHAGLRTAPGHGARAAERAGLQDAGLYRCGPTSCA